jgi:hypothetical protein
MAIFAMEARRRHGGTEKTPSDRGCDNDAVCLEGADMIVFPVMMIIDPVSTYRLSSIT